MPSIPPRPLSPGEIAEQQRTIQQYQAYMKRGGGREGVHNLRKPVLEPRRKFWR